MGHAARLTGSEIGRIEANPGYLTDVIPRSVAEVVYFVGVRCLEFAYELGHNNAIF